MALRRFTPPLPHIRWRGNVLRSGRPVARDTRAVRAVVGATPLAEGSVRVRAEVEIHTSPLPSRGRSRSNNPWREGRPNAAVERGDSTRSSCGCRRCPNCPRRSPASVRPRGRWLPATPTAALAPTPRSASAPTQRPPSGFHLPSKETAGPRRRAGLPRVGLPPPCASSGLPAKDCWTRSDPPRRLGMECTSQPPQMPQRASKKVGRYGHASVSGTAQPPRRPWRNRKPDNDLRSR